MKLVVRARFALVCGAVFLILGGAFFLVMYVMERSDVVALVTPVTVRVYSPDRRLYPVDRIPSIVAATRSQLLHPLLVRGWIGLAAGWGMRPLREVTAAARRVAQSHRLTGRIGYTGPPDEAKELADIFDTMLARLSRSFDGQRRFVANAAHELRTPLTINRTLVDVALRHADATEDTRRLGESLLVVNDRHERLIDGLLALAEGEQTVLNRHPLDLTDVVEHVLDDATAEAAAKGVTIHRLLDAAPTTGEPVLLERIAQNLVENAIRHNQPDGEVWVTTRAHRDRVELVVANTGLTVQPYEIETIFEPFRHLHGDRVRSDRGSGLGLSIVRAIADGHGGSVTASPRDDGGLIVTVELPADDPHA